MGLGPVEQAVWLTLYRDTQPNGLARTSARAIAVSAGIALSSVSRALLRLEEARLLKIVRPGGLNKGAAVYRVFGAPTE